MANPTSIDNTPAVVLCSTTEVALALNERRSYMLQHDGENDSGTAATVVVFGALDSTVDADSSEGSNKFKLVSGGMLSINRGHKELRLKTAADSVTVTILPGRHVAG